MIIDLYWQRSERAVLETAVKYGPLLTKISKNILKDPDDAAECVNDTYMAAWNAMPDARPHALVSFLAKIARNLSLKRVEYNTAQKRRHDALADFDELAEYLPSPSLIEEEFDVSELAALIGSFLKEESPEARLCFLRKYWFLDSNAEIARRYRMTEGSVAASLFRTRKKLKTYLIKEGYYL